MADLSEIIIAAISGGAITTAGQYLLPFLRGSRADRMTSEDKLRAEWKAFAEKYEAIADKERTKRLEIESALAKTRAELGMTTTAYKQLTIALHVAEKKIRLLEKSDEEKANKIERLREQVIELGEKPDTGPLDTVT